MENPDLSYHKASENIHKGTVLGKALRSLALLGVLAGGTRAGAEDVEGYLAQTQTAASSQEDGETPMKNAEVSELKTLVHVQVESDDRPAWSEVENRERREREFEKYVKNIDPGLSLGKSKVEFLGNIESFGLFFEGRHLGDIIAPEGEKTLSLHDFLSGAVRILNPYMSAGGLKISFSVDTHEEDGRVTSITMEISTEPLDLSLSISEASQKVLDSIGWRISGTVLLVAPMGERLGTVLPFESSDVVGIEVTGENPKTLTIVITMIDGSSERIVVGEGGVPKLEGSFLAPQEE